MSHKLTRRIIFIIFLFTTACVSKLEQGWTTFGNPNYIYDMLLVNNHIFWIAGPGGVAQYDSETGKTIRYTYQDGLAGKVYHLRKTPDGSILAIGEHIFRFDGAVWQEAEILPADPENWIILDIFFTPDGTPWMIGRYLPTWIAGYEIYQFVGNTWQKMLGGDFDFQLSFSPDGTVVWTASRTGLRYYQNNLRKELSYPIEHQIGINIYDFVVDAQGHSWMTFGGTGKSATLYYYDGNKWITIESEPSLSIGTIWADSTQGVWYTTQQYGMPSSDVDLIHRVGTQIKKTIALPFDDISIYSFNSFIEAQDGSIWLGSDGANRWDITGQPGLYHYKDGVWTRELLDADIPYISISSCAVDKKNQVYFSSEGRVFHWDGHSWSKNDQGSLELSELQELDGVIWAHDWQNIYLYENGQWISVFQAPDFESVNHYLIDSELTLWVTGYNATKIWIKDGDEFRTVPVQGADSLEDIKGLDIDEQGYVYLATRYRIYRWEEGAWQVFKDFENDIQTFAVINDQPWVAVYGNETLTDVYYYDGNEWKLVQGLNLDPRLNIREAIRGIYPTNNGKVIWLSTGPGWPAGGVIRYEPSKEEGVRITADDGLAENAVSDICEDHSGGIWFATWAGISRYVP